MRVLLPSVAASIVLLMLFFVACKQAEQQMVSEKVSSQLLQQINLRKAQINAPTSERLTKMKTMGMNMDNLAVQRVFIHLAVQLTSAQLDELKALGITVYPDSWIPPVGAHPTGYVLVDVPLDKLAALTQKQYVVRLETAEQLAEPQSPIVPR